MVEFPGPTPEQLAKVREYGASLSPEERDALQRAGEFVTHLRAERVWNPEVTVRLVDENGNPLTEEQKQALSDRLVISGMERRLQEPEDL